MVTRHPEHAPHAFGASSAQNAAHKPTTPNFATLDLNLLRVFDALMVERSATRAGHRLGLSQSAVSHALTRLRDGLGDELFVKGPKGMTPTPRARAIGPRLHAALSQLQAVLAEDLGPARPTFDPARADTRLTLAADPYARAILLPRVVARLRTEAPGMELRVKPGSAGLAEALDLGQLDLAIARYRRIPERFGVNELMTERHVWALRQDHPAAHSPLTLERLAALPHLVRVLADEEGAGDHLPEPGRGLDRAAVQDDDGAFTRALAGIGEHRAIRLTIPDTYTALAIVGETDLAALVPARLATRLAPLFRLKLFDPPYLSPPVPISMIWHPNHATTPATTWLRNLVIEEAAKI